MACRQTGIDGLITTLQHLTRHRDNRFKARRFNHLKAGVRRIDDTLRQAIMITQIDEDQLTMITLAVDPA